MAKRVVAWTYEGAESYFARFRSDSVDFVLSEHADEWTLVSVVKVGEEGCRELYFEKKETPSVANILTTFLEREPSTWAVPDDR